MTTLAKLLQKAESSLVEKLSKHNTDLDALLNRANNDKLVFESVDEVCKEVAPTEDEDLIQTLVSCPDLLHEDSFITDFSTISKHLQQVIDNCIATYLFDFLLEEYGFTVDSYEEDWQ